MTITNNATRHEITGSTMKSQATMTFHALDKPHFVDLSFPSVSEQNFKIKTKLPRQDFLFPFPTICSKFSRKISDFESSITSFFSLSLSVSFNGLSYFFPVFLGVKSVLRQKSRSAVVSELSFKFRLLPNPSGIFVPLCRFSSFELQFSHGRPLHVFYSRFFFSRFGSTGEFFFFCLNFLVF